jgi:hypothetical protein
VETWETVLTEPPSFLHIPTNEAGSTIILMLVGFRSITHHLLLLPRLEGRLTLCKYIYTLLLARFWTARQRNMLSCSCTACRWNKRMHGNKSSIYELVRDTREYNSRCPLDPQAQGTKAQPNDTIQQQWSIKWPDLHKKNVLYMPPEYGRFTRQGVKNM